MTSKSTPAPQAGILNRPPEHVVLAVLRITSPDPAAALATVEALRVIVHHELRSKLDPQDATSARDAPSPETGELGFADNYDRRHLTITLGFGRTAYEKLGTPPELIPQDLTPINWGQLGDSPSQPDQGDLLIQVCSDDLYICEHVVHHVEQDLRGSVELIWTLVGSQRYSTREGSTSRGEGRAVNGFIDGTSNLSPTKAKSDRALVFVDPDRVAAYPQLPTPTPAGYNGVPGSAFPTDLRTPPSQEPGWTKEGTYLVVRASTIQMPQWDQTTLGNQENVIGRFKFSGSSLDLTDDPTNLDVPPTFASNSNDLTVPVNAHVRKANPHRPEDADRRHFRRGYPLVSGALDGFDRGLIFIAFARTISTQFEFVFRAWMRNENFPNQGSGPDRIFEFEKAVLAGGYYFVPALEHGAKPWTWMLPH